MNQYTNNWKALSLWVAGVVVACGIWWLGPAIYVSVQSMLPPVLVSSVGADYSQQEQEIAQLRTQVNELRDKNRQLQLESSQTRSTLATSTLPAEQTKASVIARPPQTPYDTLLLDTGRKSGVTVGAPVWWPPGVYIGTIREVRADNALVSLTSAPGQRHTGRINQKVTVETVGQGGGSMQATVPNQLSVSTSSQVVSDRYGLVYGVIGSTQPDAVSGRKQLLIQPAIPVSVIEHVYVGKED